MQAYDSPSASDFPDMENKPVINFVIVSEDLPRGVLAKHLYDDLVDQMGEELSFMYEVWPFRGLKEAPLRELAARDAANADIIIFAVSGREELPAEVQSWIDSSLALGEKTGALVMLADRTDAETPHTDGIRAYLRKAATKAGLEFLANVESGSICEGHDDSLIENMGFREHAPLRISKRNSYRGSQPQWGLNE